LWCTFRAAIREAGITKRLTPHTAQTLPSLMIARALRDSRRPVSSPKLSLDAQVRT
jgi:hypothetical protein